MTRYLYLSPHLDDVVLSSGGTIASRLEAGDEVVIVTVFSGDPHTDCADEAAVYAGRRAEDRSAALLLSRESGSECKTIYLGLADAPFRNAKYSSFEAIVNGHLSQDAETKTRVTLRRRLGEILKREGPDVLVSPLAVGRHVDHRLVFDESITLDWEGERRFYEDRPYAFVPGCVNRRWSSIGALPDVFGPGQPVEEYPRVRFLEGYRNDVATHEETREVRRWRWNDSWFEQSKAKPSASQMRRRTHAIASYESQLTALFDATPDTAEEAIAALYGSRPEVEWRLFVPATNVTLPAITLPAKEN